MSSAQYPVKTNLPELRHHIVKFVGGTTAVTKVFGPSVDVSYTATGRVTLTWSDPAENPGTFIGITGFCFQGTTPGNVDLFQLVHEAYSASARTLVLNMYESGSLADLAALEWLTVTVTFQETAGIF
jgi:hypothetical protein